MSAQLVVAIGYSEGGLEPLMTFFDHVPNDQSTYIILRHIPVGQRGALSEILQRHSKLKILEAEDGMIIKNDLVYIPPSTHYMTIENDHLYLHSRSRESRLYNYSINIFLRSLAKDKGESSIAVILSGTGVDGSDGVKHIHEAGGMVIVQTPASCVESEMPQNAIDTGCVDEILLPAEMPDIITKYVHPVLKNENLQRRLKE